MALRLQPMTKTYVCLLCAAFISSPVFADLGSDIRKCAAEKNSIARLACYDKLAPQAEAQDPAKSLSRSSKWMVRTETSRIDDSRNVFLMLEAEEPIHGWPSKTFTPQLQIRCKERKTEAYFVTGMPPTVEYGIDSATITLRIDKQPAFKLAAGKSTDGEALFLPQATTQIKRFMSGQTLLFQFIPFNSSSQMATFDVRGLAEALKPLRDACKW
jgi:type VI secretion system protein VasI